MPIVSQLDPRKIKLSLFLITLTVLSFLISTSVFQEKSEFKKCVGCNVILISIDALRADHLKTYGYFRNTTPNIDNLAERGILFEQAITQAPWTTPSHMSLFTSLYPITHGVDSIDEKLNKSFVTLPERLNLKGYKTLAIATKANTMDPEIGFGRGFEQYYRKHDFEDIYEILTPWMERNFENKFFIFLHLVRTHDPYLSPPSYSKAFDPGYNGSIPDPDEVKKFALTHYEPNEPWNGTLFDQVVRPFFWDNVNTSDPRDIYHLNALYDGAILYTDKFVGSLIQRLTALGIDNETIIIVLADHGEEFLDHGGFMHGKELYDETIHVPMVIYNPKIKGGIRIENQAQLVDLMPTLLDFLNISAPNQAQGKSLVKLIEGKTERDFNKFAYSMHGRDLSVRTNEWKLIHRENKTYELYNLENDKGETKNVMSKNKEIFNKLEANLRNFVSTFQLKPSTREEIEKRLREIGYLR